MVSKTKIEPAAETAATVATNLYNKLTDEEAVGFWTAILLPYAVLGSLIVGVAFTPSHIGNLLAIELASVALGRGYMSNRSDRTNPSAADMHDSRRRRRRSW